MSLENMHRDMHASATTRATVICNCGGGTFTIVGYAHIEMSNGTIAARAGNTQHKMLRNTATASEMG